MAKAYEITKDDAEKIKEYRKGIKDKIIDRRLYAVQLCGEGMRNQVEVSEIKKEYDKAVVRDTGTQIYNVLHRHNWRKVMPRSQHPKKAIDEAIEASKKLTHLTKS